MNGSNSRTSSNPRQYNTSKTYYNRSNSRRDYNQSNSRSDYNRSNSRSDDDVQSTTTGKSKFYTDRPKAEPRADIATVGVSHGGATTSGRNPAAYHDNPRSSNNGSSRTGQYPDNYSNAAKDLHFDNHERENRSFATDPLPSANAWENRYDTVSLTEQNRLVRAFIDRVKDVDMQLASDILAGKIIIIVCRALVVCTRLVYLL